MCQNVCTFTSITPMTTANTTPRKARTRQQKRRRLCGGPFFSFLPLRQREREREYNFRVYFFVKTSSDKIERTIKTLHSYFRTHLCTSSFRTQKQRANTHHHHHHHPGGRRRTKNRDRAQLPRASSSSSSDDDDASFPLDLL